MNFDEAMDRHMDWLIALPKAIMYLGAFVATAPLLLLVAMATSNSQPDSLGRATYHFHSTFYSFLVWAYIALAVMVVIVTSNRFMITIQYTMAAATLGIWTYLENGVRSYGIPLLSLVVFSIVTTAYASLQLYLRTFGDNFDDETGFEIV